MDARSEQGGSGIARKNHGVSSHSEQHQSNPLTDPASLVV